MTLLPQVLCLVFRRDIYMDPLRKVYSILTEKEVLTSECMAAHRSFSHIIRDFEQAIADEWNELVDSFPGIHYRFADIAICKEALLIDFVAEPRLEAFQ